MPEVPHSPIRRQPRCGVPGNSQGGEPSRARVEASLTPPRLECEHNTTMETPCLTMCFLSLMRAWLVQHFGRSLVHLHETSSHHPLGCGTDGVRGRWPAMLARWRLRGEVSSQVYYVGRLLVFLASPGRYILHHSISCMLLIREIAFLDSQGKSKEKKKRRCCP